jgi:6-phosphogluconolactonase/glucosamine-6-phosphate isomerase/deaminase
MQVFNSDINFYNFLVKKLEDEKIETLFLSGGTTFTEAYKLFSIKNPKLTNLKQAILLDERFGKPMHKNSNELTLKNSGILSYFKNNKIKFYSLLKNNENDIKSLFLLFAKTNHVALIGMGLDGHIAGILSNSLTQNTKEPVIKYNSNDVYKSRLTVSLNYLNNFLANNMLVIKGNQKLEAFNALKDNKSTPIGLLNKKDLSVIYLKTD